MFEKLKKLIFDESIELEPEESPFDSLSDSLESNKNLIKTEPYRKSKEMDTEELVENSLKRIDLDELIEKSEITLEQEEKEIEEKVVEPVFKPSKKVVKKPQYYKPRPVISPMFGISVAENERTSQLKALSKPEEATEDERIISPMYGIVTAEQEIVTKQSKPATRRRKAAAVNISLEEMLNMPSNEELEFTLFDVKVDKTEFQSRENTLMDKEKEQ